MDSTSASIEGASSGAGRGADTDQVLADEWIADHFDPLAPELSPVFDETLERMRSQCPVAHSDRHGGFWVVSAYEDVLHVLQDWRTFSNAQGISIPMRLSDPPLPPDETDPPVHRDYKRLINAYLTPAVVARSEQPTRRMANELIDAFIEEGSCEWISAFANPFPRLTFFENVFHAPPDDIPMLNEWIDIVTTQRNHLDYLETNRKLVAWIEQFVADRRSKPPQGDIVDAVINAEIDGQPITRAGILGTLQLLMFGGFETTTAALGHVLLRFARDPELPARLARQPELVPESIEEFLRLESPVVAMARSVLSDTKIGGKQLRKGDKLMFSLSSANRDETEFENPDQFHLNRNKNRHLAFGAGPHRCAGSSLARMNLRVALEQVVWRLHDLRLQDGAEPIQYLTAFTRTPKTLPIAFTPGPKIVS
jgi:cytochrome P450